MLEVTAGTRSRVAVWVSLYYSLKLIAASEL